MKTVLPEGHARSPQVPRTEEKIASLAAARKVIYRLFLASTRVSRAPDNQFNEANRSDLEEPQRHRAANPIRSMRVRHRRDES